MEASISAERTLADANIASLVLMLRFHEVTADPAQIRHRFGAEAFGASEILRCAKELKIRARLLETDRAHLNRTPLPALAEDVDGRFVVLGRVLDDKVLIQDPAVGRPQLVPREEFERRWSGRLVLMTRRARLGDLARHFDITWFLRAIHKYRRLLAEVLVASFFLQLFGLVTPLFFQVVTDKVLTHRGFTTLDVLMIGLITVWLFESVLGVLRTYVFCTYNQPH